MGNKPSTMRMDGSFYEDGEPREMSKYYSMSSTTKTYSLDNDGASRTIVHKSTDERYTSDTYPHTGEDTNADKFLEQYEKIYQVYQAIDHPNLMQLHEVYQRNKKSVIFIRTHCEGDELFDRIVESPTGRIEEKQGARYMHQILQALGHLHDRGIAHRNIKPECVHFLVKEDISGHIFGADKLFLHLSTYLTAPGEGQDLTLPCGTPGYCAPEILRRNTYGKECDMWSVGVTCFSMLSGVPPFADDDLSILYKQIKRGSYKYDITNAVAISSDAKQFVKALLQTDPAKRMSCSEALVHPWITANI